MNPLPCRSWPVGQFMNCSVMTKGVNGKRYWIKCPLAELCSACLVCYLLFWVCLQSLTHSLLFWVRSIAGLFTKYNKKKYVSLTKTIHWANL